MKKFKHTRRSAILFFLLTPFTLFIYPIVVLSHVGKDLNRLGERVIVDTNPEWHL